MYTVADLMTRDVLTLRPEDDLALAETILSLGGIRHLPVAQGTALVGLITQRDVLRTCSNLPADAKRSMLARQVMRRDLYTVQSGTPLRDALGLILEHKIGCLPVIEDDNRLIGIITETDVVRFALRQVHRQETLATLGVDAPGTAAV